MANIVELRELSDDKLEEKLENAREEMFNLRFQNASARLEDYSRLKHVRREIAQLESTLYLRQLAENAATAQPEIMAILTDKNWQASARFSYEDSAWRVQFVDDEGNELALAMVNLHQKVPRGRHARRKSARPNLVTSYEIAE